MAAKKAAKAAPAAASVSEPEPAPVPSAPPARAAAPPTLTLKHLAAELADKHSMDKKQAEALASDLVGLLVAHLKGGDRLRLAGLGVLEVKHRPARAGRNPATGEAMQIAASTKVAFRPAKELKEAV